MRGSWWKLLVPSIVAACGSDADGGLAEGSGLPGGVQGPAVTIKPGETVTAASDTCQKEPVGLVVEGELVVPDDKDIEICARWVLVRNGGRLRIGSETAPFTHKATFTLTAPDAKENVMEMGTKFIGAMTGGVLDLHGAAPATSWTKLAGPVAAGATSIDLAEPVSPAAGPGRSWEVGDEILVTSGTVEGREAETFRITAVAGAKITLDRPVAKVRPGAVRTVAGRQVDTRTEVANLTRNIVIRGDEASTQTKFGGHMMIMPSGKGFIDGAEMQRMGQFDQLARYPIHWHLAGDVAGQYIKRSTVNRSFQRGITVHGVQKLLVQDNVVFDTVGHNYLVETPDTVDNVWDHNLAAVTRLANFTQATLKTQGDDEASNWWIRAAKNTFTRNSAAGSVASGFWFDATNDAGLVFQDNVAHSATGNATDEPDQKSKIDFNRESGIFAENLEALKDGDERPNKFYAITFERTTLFQNQTDLWPKDGAQVYKDTLFADSPGPAITGEGCFVTFENAFFAGPSPFTKTSPAPVHTQYSGKIVLENPTFVGYPGVFMSHDINLPFMSDFVIRGARLVNMPAGAGGPDGFSVLETLDDSYMPRGFYVPDSRSLIVPGMTQVVASAPGDPGIYRRSDRLAYATLTLTNAEGRVQSAAGYTVTRSDGMTTTGEAIGAPIASSGGFSYQLAGPAPSTVVKLLLDPQGSYNQLTLPPAIDTLAVEVAFPLAKAPTKVELPAAALTAAASLAAFRSGGATYFYDADAKLLYVRVGFDAVTIRP